MPGYAFKFISGKYQGGEFPIPDDGELLIGRFSEVDLVLVEDMVSRKHAKLTASGDDLVITDLGSTNGTFVNGEKVRRANLRPGDRVLVGTSILKVIAAGEMTVGKETAEDKNALRQMMQDLADRSSQSAATMSGELDEVPLPDLLQLFATNKKSGTLTIRGANQGRVLLKEGQLEYVEIKGHEDFLPMKALCRMLGWQEGTFHLETYDDSIKRGEGFTESTESLLIEALRQLDEIHRAEKSLPARNAKLTWSIPLMPKLSDLSKSELDVLQYALNFEILGAVVDRYPGADLEVLQVLSRLLRDGYLEVD